MSEYATVDEMIEKLQEISDQGFGRYILTFNDEYYAERKDENPVVSEHRKIVDMGGYFPI